jgi:hypothetical protein
MVHPRRSPLGVMGGCAGRHRALSAGSRVGASVAGCFTCGSSSFREGADETVGCWSVPVLGSAGRGWQRVYVTTPCSPACCAWLGGMQMFGNAQHALRVLGGTWVSGWHARCAACGGFEAAASRGIDHTRVEELSGEVTGPGAVGAVQPKMGVHDGQGYGAGGVGCLRTVSVGWGQF